MSSSNPRGSRIKEIAKTEINKYKDLIYQSPQDLNKVVNDNPTICLEIGMGKGGFINQLAQINPKKFYLGIEAKEERCLSSAKIATSNKTKNLAIFCGNFLINIDFFKNLKCQEIWLNFSDPWPKKRHIKRRLLNNNSITSFKNMLDQKGILYIKTDNKPLYEYDLELLTSENWQIIRTEDNLHKSDFPIQIMTEFETKYTKAGKPTYLIVAKP